MLILTIKIIAICAMLTFMFIGIWGFILLIKIYDQLRYKNYLMEKLIQNTSKLSLAHENIAQPKKDIEAYDTFNLTEKEILDLNIKKDAI
ncbi:hypothetical protein [Clostridium sp. FP1]|uniref:hypothetical protein n=1 Tax=Clostridium sp. FP1 TaxID=2724076 RepID=UPI0013E90FBF|nr:hypothetical protein [Clostridium sp. FP1]MBZ9636729.1 hypothetical protein [Clostridium sp. FP1]